VSENRARVRALLPAEPVWLKQVHGTRVWDADLAPAEEVIEADAAVTTKPNTVLTVMAADCLPVLISSSDGGVIGAAHAGWRGLLGGVLENTVDAMLAKIGLDDTGQYLAWLGPAIGPRHSRWARRCVLHFTIMPKNTLCRVLLRHLRQSMASPASIGPTFTF
jgi:polyphenol oxidase